jgi:hypothetical protein
MRAHLAITAVAFVALVCQSSPSQAEITYNFLSYPDLYNGSTLSGSITTDGTTGTIDDSNLISWQFSITPPTGSGLLVWTGDQTTTHTDYPWTVMEATPQTLTIGVGDYLVINDNTSSAGIDWDGTWSPMVVAADPNGNPYWTHFDNGDIPTLVIAAATPEPSTLVLLGIGAVSLLAYARRRRGWTG